MKQILKFSAVTVSAIALGLCALAADKKPSPKSAIEGTVTFKGDPPKNRPIQMAADPVCQKQYEKGMRLDEAFVIEPKTGAIANVFLYIKEGLTDKKAPVPKESKKVFFDQKGCWYHPHVFGIQVGQTLEIHNSDPTLHNIKSLSQKSNSFNSSMPKGSNPMEKVFKKPEVMVKVKCNVHPWMHAYAGVLEHSFYAVSDKNGSFAISNVPPGKYLVEAWHEKLGSLTKEVTVAEGKPTKLQLIFEKDSSGKSASKK